MTHTPLPPSAILSGLRVNIFTNGGDSVRHFNLYRLPFCPYLISPCKRITVHPHRVEIDGTRHRLADQFTVYVNDKRVPDHQYSTTRAHKPKQYKAAPRHKQTRGQAVSA